MLFLPKAEQTCICGEHGARREGYPVRRANTAARGGFTLLELIVVITVGAALMAAAIRVFVPLMQVHSRYVAEVARQTRTWEIAALWRRDARAARAVTLHRFRAAQATTPPVPDAEEDRAATEPEAAGAQRGAARGDRTTAAPAQHPAWSVEFAMPDGVTTVSYRFYPRERMLRRYEQSMSDGSGATGSGTLHVRQWRIDGRASSRVQPLAAEAGDGETDGRAVTAVTLRLQFRLLVPVSGRSLEGRFREYAIVGVVR